MAKDFSQALSGKSEAPMAASAMSSIVALVDWGVSDSSSWLRSACRRLDLFDGIRLEGVAGVDAGVRMRCGFLEQCEER